MIDALARAGAFAGFDEQREKLARDLAKQDPPPTPGQIDFLARHYHRSGGNTGLLIHLLRSGRWVKALKTLRHSAAFLNTSPNGDPAGKWAKDGEVEDFLEATDMPCGCSWGDHKLGPRTCKKAGFTLEH